MTRKATRGTSEVNQIGGNSGQSPAQAPARRSRGYRGLITAIAGINSHLVARVATAANQALVLRNWIVGAYIVEFEQHGAGRAKYGARLLESLAADLAGRGVKGLDVRTLRDCRSFFALYPQIRGALSPELIGWLPTGGERQEEVARQPRSRKIRVALSPESPTPLDPNRLVELTWSHFQELIALDDVWQRAFYENECLLGRWSVRQLQRQIGSMLYERTGLSTNKQAVIQRARKQQPIAGITDVLRDPYVLEFTGIAERPEYSEDDLETALLDHVQRFLLELGRGFCFEARQFRIREGRSHHRVDLVFYHRILRCHVLIDLKIRAFRPADAGQMNFYLNWFKTHMAADGDQPPVGILLCSDKDSTEVEFATAGMDQTLFVSRYLPKLPSIEQLKNFLERDRANLKALIRRKDD